MWDAFRAGGWGMVPTLMAGVLLVIASVHHVRRPVTSLLWNLAMVTCLCGGLGFVTGVIATTTALGDFDGDVVRIALVGLGESLHNIALALLLITIAAGISTLGSGRRTWTRGERWRLRCRRTWAQVDGVPGSGSIPSGSCPGCQCARSRNRKRGRSDCAVSLMR